MTIEDIYKCGKSIAYLTPMHEGSQKQYFFSVCIIDNMYVYNTQSYTIVDVYRM